MADDSAYPQPGDLIEIKRSPVYQHWALYVGDGYVIHVADVGPRDVSMSVGSSSNSTGTAKVKKELLRKVAGNSEWSVNNKYDKLHTPLPVEKIVQNAERLIDMEIPYNLLKDNCEHFVTLLRYDNKISDQVNNAIYLSSALLAFSLIVITIPMSISLAKKRKKYAGTAQGVQNEEGEIDVCPQLAEDENAERKTHDDLTEKVYVQAENHSYGSVGHSI